MACLFIICNSGFQRAEALNFDEVQFIIFSFMACALISKRKLRSQRFSLMLTFGSFYDYGFDFLFDTKFYLRRYFEIFVAVP
jgi:hypothetical protein